MGIAAEKRNPSCEGREAGQGIGICGEIAGKVLPPAAKIGPNAAAYYGVGNVLQDELQNPAEIWDLHRQIVVSGREIPVFPC